MIIRYTERGAGDASAQARRLLSEIYTELFGAPMPEIAKTPTGKPYFPTHPDAYFSLSHAKSHVICVMAEQPVGIDLETIRPVRREVPGRVCAEEELKQFSFFQLWTLKESFIKLTDNPRLVLRETVFERRGGEIVAPHPDVRARIYETIPGCMAAVCCFGEEPAVIATFVPPENLC